MNTSSFSSNLHSFWNVSINWRGALNILNTWNEKRSVFSQTLSSLKNILNLNIQSDSIVRQTNKVHVLSYTTMNSNHIFLLQFFQVHQLNHFFIFPSHGTLFPSWFLVPILSFSVSANFHMFSDNPLRFQTFACMPILERLCPLSDTYVCFPNTSVHWQTLMSVSGYFHEFSNVSVQFWTLGSVSQQFHPNFNTRICLITL